MNELKGVWNRKVTLLCAVLIAILVCCYCAGLLQVVVISGEFVTGVSATVPHNYGDRDIDTMGVGWYQT